MIARAALALVAAALLAGAAQAAGAEYREGEHYERIEPAQPTRTGDKIEVLEIFWYGCPHCYDFEPYIERWLEDKPADVAFRRLPGVFRRSWVPHARAFYTAKSLGVLDSVHGALFRAIHEQQRHLADEESLARFFVEQGIAREEFDEVYTSFAIDSKVRQAASQAAGYRIRGVPSVIVNGKYRSSGSMAGSYERLLEIIDLLVDKERQALARAE